MVHHFINVILLPFHVVVVIPVLHKCALHAAHNAILRADPLLGEPPAIVLFRIVKLVLHITLYCEAHRLLFVHILHELLPVLQVLNTLLRQLVFFLQPLDSVLDLLLLVLLFLGRHNRVHHYVLRLLRGYRTHS